MWKDLIKSAVLGIDKKPISPELMTQWSDFGLPLVASNPQQYFLNAIVFGDKLHQLTVNYYENSIETFFVKNPFGKSTSIELSNILGGIIGFSDSLFEKKILLLLISNEYEIPAEHLPYLIEKGKLDAFFNDFLIANGGEIFNYLVIANKDWTPYYTSVNFAGMSNPLQLDYLRQQIKKNRVAAFDLFYTQASLKKKLWIESALKLFDFDTDKNKPYKQLFMDSYASKSCDEFIIDSKKMHQLLERECSEILKSTIHFNKKIAFVNDKKIIIQHELICRHLGILLTHTPEEMVAILLRHVDLKQFFQNLNINAKEGIAAIFDNEKYFTLQQAFIENIIAFRNLQFFLWSLKYLKSSSIQLFIDKTIQKWNDAEFNMIVSKLTNENILQLEQIWLESDHVWNQENLLRFLTFYEEMNDKINHLKLFNKIILSVPKEMYLKYYFQAREIFNLKNGYLQDFKEQQRKLDLLNQFYKNMNAQN